MVAGVVVGSTGGEAGSRDEHERLWQQERRLHVAIFTCSQVSA